MLSDACESHLTKKPYVTPLDLWNNWQIIRVWNSAKVKLPIIHMKPVHSSQACECSPKDFATLSRLACRPPGWSPLMLLSDGVIEVPVLDTVGTKMSPMDEVLSTLLCWLPNTAAKSSWTWLSNGFVEVLLLKPVENEAMVCYWALFLHRTDKSTSFKIQRV